jgi:hypothetical protein
MKISRLHFLSALLALFPLENAMGESASSRQPDMLTVGGDLRLRNEYMNNALSLSDNAVGHDQDYYRIRARVWAALQASESLSFNARITAEPRIWMESPTFARQHPGLGAEERYAIVDLLNAKWTASIADDWTLSCTAGRQDVQLGDVGKWWLVADASPGDGSWTASFDALRFTFENKASHTKMEFIALETRALPDSNLPVLGARSTYSLTEQNERGLIAYVTQDLSPGTQWSGYAIYKKDSKALANGDDGETYTFGTRVSGSLSEHWRYDCEGALQGGWKRDAMLKRADVVSGSRDVRAWGANARLSYLLNDSMQNKLSLECEYLSGDDPHTDNDEMFDILWGRYPRWSDAYAFAYAQETGGKLGQMNNLLRIGPSWSCSPVKSLSLTAAYAVLMAPESTPTRATNAGLFSFDGHMRGHFWQMIAKYQFTKSISALVCGELVAQGDYYANKDTQSFVRFELYTRF